MFSYSVFALTAKFFKQGCRYHKLRKQVRRFFKIYRRHSGLVEKYNVNLKNFCKKIYRNQNSMVSELTDLEMLWGNLMFWNNSENS